jgi:hypothetical protein
MFFFNALCLFAVTDNAAGIMPKSWYSDMFSLMSMQLVQINLSQDPTKKDLAVLF